MTGHCSICREDVTGLREHVRLMHPDGLTLVDEALDAVPSFAWLTGPVDVEWEDLTTRPFIEDEDWREIEAEIIDERLIKASQPGFLWRALQWLGLVER